MSNFTCPGAGPGAWHSCASGSKFVGCCLSDPCNDLGCSAGNLFAASFDSSLYGKFPDLTCDQGAQFYTCNFTEPPFWGCCKSNPCGTAQGCPIEDLAPTYLGSNPGAVAFYSPTGLVSPKASASMSPLPEANSDNSVIAAAVGGGVGGLVVGAMLIFFLCWRRRRGRHVTEQTDTCGEQTIPTNFGADDGPIERFIMVDKPTHQRNCSNLSPPPRYSVHAPPVFELEDQPGLKQNRPVELVGSPPQSGCGTERIDPAELDTSSLPANRVELDSSADIYPIVPSNLVPAPTSSTECYSSIASTVKKQPAAINTQHRFTMASLQSEIFLEGGDTGRSNPASLDSPLIHPVSPLAPECDLMPHMSLEAVDDDHPRVNSVRPRSA